MRYSNFVLVLLTTLAASLTAASLLPQPIQSQAPQVSQVTRTCPVIDAGRATNPPPDPDWKTNIREKHARQRDFIEEGLEFQAFSSVVFSHDGQFLIAGTKHVGKQRNRDNERTNINGTVTVFTNLKADRWSGNKIYESKRESTAVTVSPNGNLLAASDANGKVRLWRREQWSKLRVTAPAESVAQAIVYSLAFSPDNKFLISAGTKGNRGGILQLWNVSRGALQPHKAFPVVKHLELPETTEIQEVSSVAFSPNGAIVAAAGKSDLLSNKIEVTYDNKGKRKIRRRQIDGRPFITFWNTQKREYICTLSDSTLYARSVVFSPDGSLFAAAGTNGTIKLWALPNLGEPKLLLGHGTVVNSIAFSPSGRILLSGGSDGKVKLWSVATGQEIKSFENNSEAVTSVAFRPDGRAFATGSMDGTVQLYVYPEN